MMKKLFLTLVSAVMLMATGHVQAQAQEETDDLLCRHCQEVASSRYGNTPVSNIVPYKVAYWCSFSKACFFETDSVPAGVPVYSIGEVTVKKSGVRLPADYVVNLDSLNFFALDFAAFQQRPGHWNSTIYYSTPGSQHAYLGVRSYGEAMKRIDNADLLRRYEKLPDNYFNTDKEDE